MASEERTPTTLGGQAVIEGVLIRGPRAAAVCVRRPDGEIACRIERMAEGGRWRRIPLVRGLAALAETTTQGMRAMVWSAQVAAGRDPEEPSRRQTLTTALTSLVAASLFFVLGPATASRRLERFVRDARLAALLEGALRLTMLIGYLRAVGRLPQARRLFAYHGAEHRAIQAYEAGLPLEVATLERFPNAHVRCGTSFLLTAAVFSSVFSVLVGRQSAGQRVLTRLALTPLVAGLSYEAIRLAGGRFGPALRWLFRPNLALQALTTRDPDHAQMEVALAAVRAALAAHERA